VGALQASQTLLVEDGNHGEYRPRPDEFVDAGVSFIRAADMSDGRVLFESAGCINRLARLRIRKGVGRPGDVLLSHKGTVGKVALVQRDCPEFVCSPQTTFWRVLNDDVLDRRYLFAYLQSQEFKDQLSSRKGETDMADYVSLTAQRQLTVPLPPVEIQRGIGEHLAVLSDRITLLRETNTTLEAIAQALFKSWFVDFDPVRAKMEGRAPEGMDEATAALFPDELEESALSPMPKGWTTITLAALVKQYGGSIQTGPFGSQLHASDYVDDGIPIVMPKDIENRRVTTDFVARVDAANAERLSRHKLRSGDIVFSRRGDVEKHALIGEREAGWLCGTGCLLVRPGSSWTASTFLSMALDAPNTRTWLVQHAVGATMPNLNTGILGSVRLVLPSSALLAAVERLISVSEALRSQNASTIETLAILRDTLLPRLISGQLRLPEVTEALGNESHASSY
jgi:type I restriction enzyme S subunit